MPDDPRLVAAIERSWLTGRASPGFATDLALLGVQGDRTVEERADYWSVRTPANPTYHWGNA